MFLCRVLAVLTALSVTETAQAIEDASITLDPKISLSSLIDQTMERHPQSVALRAAENTAEAESKFARQWFPEAAQLEAFHMTDRHLDDIGANETEAAVSVGLWLPGEKRAQSDFSDAMETSQSSGRAAFRWYVSGLVRNRAWQLRRSWRQWELAAEQESRLMEVLEQVTLFTQAGDTSRADLLDTMQELAIWKAETMTLEAEYRDMIHEFVALTGSTRLPVELTESLSNRQDLADDHPALRRALDYLAQSQAAAELAGQGNTARPSINVFWRDFRGDRASPDVNALGLGFSVPLGKSPSRGPEVAKAYEKLANAEAELQATRRELDLQLHETRHLLHTTGRQLKNSNAMMDSASEKHRLDKLSFELGEISVRQWLRRLSELKEIEQSHELLLLQQGAAIAAYNQAVGESL